MTLFIGTEVIVKAPPCGDSGKAEEFLHQSTPMVVFGKWQTRRKLPGTFIITLKLLLIKQVLDFFLFLKVLKVRHPGRKKSGQSGF